MGEKKRSYEVYRFHAKPDKIDYARIVRENAEDESLAFMVIAPKHWRVYFREDHFHRYLDEYTDSANSLLVYKVPYLCFIIHKSDISQMIKLINSSINTRNADLKNKAKKQSNKSQEVKVLTWK